MLDAVAWADAEELVRELIEQIVEPYGVSAEVTYQRGVPPVVNEHRLHRAARPGGRAGARRARATCPRSRASAARTSRWYLERVPGAMGRLGTRTPGGPTYDLHQGDLRVDERAIAIGARVLAEARARRRWSRDGMNTRGITVRPTLSGSQPACSH